MNKNEAARQRVQYARHHIVEAQETLDKALQALSSVTGLLPFWKKLRKVSDDAKTARRDLDALYYDDEHGPDKGKLQLDRTPDDKDEARYAPPADVLLNEETQIERDQEIKIWDLTPESALAFFGLPPGTKIRVLKERPETEREKERYAPEAKLFGIRLEDD